MTASTSGGKLQAELSELQARRTRALAMGNPKKLQERRDQGILNARERLDYLLDKHSFVEVGLLAKAIRPEVRDRSPADGK